MKHIILIAFVTLFTSVVVFADDLKIIRERVVIEIMKVPANDAEVGTLLNTFRSDATWPGIDYIDLSRSGFDMQRHAYHILTLGKAYKNPKSKYYNNKEVKITIEKALRYWIEKDFFGKGWHVNQISVPVTYVSLMLIMGNEISKDIVDNLQPIIGRAHPTASGARQSGDRIKVVAIYAMNMLFLEDNEKFDEAVEIIANEMRFTTLERGLQHDLSFHHRVDRVNNTVSYGYGKYANTYGEWAHYVAGTKYQFPDEKIEMMVDYYLDGVYKHLVYGVYPDYSVANRSIAIRRARVLPAGTEEIEKVLQVTDYRRDELQEILNLRNGMGKPTKSFAKFFWQSDHFVFQRPNFYTTVRMYSTRNANMERPYNSIGFTTHHRGDGTNHVVLKGDEYFNVWPMYDWQKIPGTTVLQKPQLVNLEGIEGDAIINVIGDQLQRMGHTDFVGAVTDDLYGAVGFDFISPHDNITAKKSWFFFDDEYVCLGAGISSDSDRTHHVVTTLNQTSLQSDVNIMSNGKEEKISKGNHEFKNTKWVYHNNIAYLLQEPVDINLSNKEEKGRWTDISKYHKTSDKLETKEIFKLWIDHGSNPGNESYAYIVIPDISEKELNNAVKDNRGIEILSNNTRVQAVENTKLNICQFTFFKSGEVEIANGKKVKMDSQGMAMLKFRGDKVTELTVSDPSRKLSKINITIPGIYKNMGEGVKTLPNEANNETLMTIDLPQGFFAGNSVKVLQH